MKSLQSRIPTPSRVRVLSPLMMLLFSASAVDAQVLKFPSTEPLRERVVQTDSVFAFRIDTLFKADRTVERVDTVKVPSPVAPQALTRLVNAWDASRLISQGQLSLRDAKPVVGLNLYELYISPDFEGWRLHMPIVVSTASVIAQSRDEVNRVASSLLDAAAGVLNVTATNHKQFRQTRSDGTLSMSGIYLDYGFVVKGDVVSDSSNRSSLFVTAGPHARVDLRVTTSRSRDAGDYAGLIHLRLGITGNFMVERPAAFDQLYGVDVLSRSAAFEFALGWFPVNSASVNLVKYTPGIGNLPQAFGGRWSTGVSLFAR